MEFVSWLNILYLGIFKIKKPNYIIKSTVYFKNEKKLKYTVINFKRIY